MGYFQKGPNLHVLSFPGLNIDGSVISFTLTQGMQLIVSYLSYLEVCVETVLNLTLQSNGLLLLIEEIVC